MDLFIHTDKALILYEVSGRDRVVCSFRKFSRFRMWRNPFKVHGRPMRRDIPKMAWHMLKVKLCG